MKLLLHQAIAGESSLYLLRSKLRAVSQRMGFAATRREHMELVIHEIVTNQAKYAGGHGLVQIWEQHAPEPSLHLFALDYGPGVANLPAALEDGYTSGGTLGKGLGPVRRLADRHDFYTLPQGMVSQAPWHGLSVWAQFCLTKPTQPVGTQVGIYLRAYQDNIHNGDRLCLEQHDWQQVRWLHLDGLGHGEEAEVGTEGACEAFAHSASVEQAMRNLGAQLTGTRGAVAMACEIDLPSGQGKICGVGDMAAYLMVNGTRRTITFAPGVLGHAHRQIDSVDFEFPSHALLLTASDGIRRSWEANDLPGLWRTHPQLIAFFLGEVVGRHNDDRSLLAFRHNTSGE
jgi:anti-sigma regulatory factor (Ser/Thr protein kinase)